MALIDFPYETFFFFHVFVWFCGVLVSISSPHLLRYVLWKKKFNLALGLGDVDVLIPA